MENNSTPSHPPNPSSYEPQQPASDTRRKKKSEGWRSVASTLAILISAPVIALLLITFVFQSYVVDGPSMENTLQDGDRLIVSKVGKSLSQLRDEDFLPDRGEIIVFAKKGTFDPVARGERQLIKRVVGLPGDRVTIQSGTVTIVNDDNPNGFNPDTTVGYNDLIASRGGATDIDITVPEGAVFVMGDNRSNSQDSRSFGVIASDEIIGELSVRIFPFHAISTF